MISTKISRKPVLAFAALTAVIAFLLFKYVELKPQVDEHFFFSSDDPHFQDEKKISTMFPQVPQIVVAARGNIRTPEYGKSIEDLTLDVEKLSDVFGVQSLTRGPDGVQDAIESPLWKRTLVSEDAKASFLFAFLRKNPDSEFILNLEALREKYSRPAFEVMISGAPYIVELIRRSLFRDLKIFSAAAFAIFSIALLIIFRSLWIVAGVTVACFNASALTLLIAKIVHLQTGFLTANLPTIVFVLTLSHIAFLTAEWKQLMIEAGDYRPGLAWVAARNTFSAALWSTFTALLGFLTLLFVQAQSLRQLGLSGSLGTLVALVAAYIFYPWFLEHQKKNPSFLEAERAKKTRVADFIDRRPRWVLLALLALTIFSCFALPQLDTDPSLFAYFKKNSEIRNGLEYIDRHGGSNPLSIVIEDPENTKLNDSDAYSKMWRLHLALEKDPAVGHVVSLPILLAEAKRSFIANLMKLEWLLDAMDSPRFGEVAKYFVTEDRHHSLYILRMKEQDQAEPRMNVVNRLKEVVRKQGYIPIHVGGVFMLQGRLSELVASSLISGSAFLNLASMRLYVIAVFQPPSSSAAAF